MEMIIKYPGDGMDVVLRQISVLMNSMEKFHWSHKSYQENENNPLLKSFAELKEILRQFTDLKEVELSTFLDPFLDVIRSEETSVQVTILALSAVNKFISYGLIGGINDNYLLPVIENIADIVAHANFITTDHSTDNLIFAEIVRVLRTLVLSPLGNQLSNDSICEIMLSCFKICFETRINETQRRCAERCLEDIVQFLFSRLSLLIQTPTEMGVSHFKKMRIRPKNKDNAQKKRNKQTVSRMTESKKPVISYKDDYRDNFTVTRDNISSTDNLVISNEHSMSNPDSIDKVSEVTQISEENCHPEVSQNHNLESVNSEKQDSIIENNVITCTDLNTKINTDQNISLDAVITNIEKEGKVSVDSTMENNVKTNEINYSTTSSPVQTKSSNFTDEISHKQYIVNSQGVRFMSDDPNLKDWLVAERIPLEPHNSVCVQELLRFLALIINPYDKQNTDIMRHISLSLIIVALEFGAGTICEHPTLLSIVKDTLCKNLLSLLNSERVPKQIFESTLHVLYLLFKSMRYHLKFQMEYFLSRLSELIISETPKVSYDLKKLALETLVQLWQIPGLVTELFLNYDCDLYCSNLYEDITKLLAKNVYMVDGIYSTHLMSLNALLSTVESIDKHCHTIMSSGKVINETNPDYVLNVSEEVSLKENALENENCDKQPTDDNAHNYEQPIAIKRKKKLLTTGTEHFNTNPKKGIQFLQEQGLLSTPLEPAEVATFLRENPHLDKKMIGEFISRESNLQILQQFVKSFDFTDMRLDQALRLYLESFRLPGESPLIILVLEQFTDYWHKSNNEPFSNSDSAFVLAYAIIMLNTDLHNFNVRRQQPPMSLEDFKKNLKERDDGKDFDQDLLDAIYQSIKNEEIVMPAEHVGLVRENYLWKMLLRRGSGKDGNYRIDREGQYDHELFSLCWSSVVAALSYVFDKAADSSVYYKSIQGFRKCATISAHYGMSNEFDYLTISLCKFTMLTNSLENPESFVVSFGMNAKARLAARTIFDLVHRYGDVLREGWRPLFDCIFQLFRCKLLPKILVEGEDFLELSGKISLIREDNSSHETIESGLLSSLYSYITLAADSQKITSEEEKEYTEIAKTCITDCHIENLIQESKFLRLESLHELLKVVIRACYNSECNITINTKQDEDKAIFFLELLLKVVIQNRDRTSSVWPMVCDHLHTLLMASAVSEQEFLIERCVIGLLRLAIRLIRRDEITSSVLQSLQIILLLKWNTVYSVSRQVSYGLYELLKTGAADIHSEADWMIIFTLFEVVGAGAPLPKLINCNDNSTVKSSNDVTTNDSNNLEDDKQYSSNLESNLSQLNKTNLLPSYKSYLFFNDNNDGDHLKTFYTCNELLSHDPFSLVKCCESLAFLIRDVAHITPFNFKNCIHTIRTFVEATLYSGERKQSKKKPASVSKIRMKMKNATYTKKSKFNINLKGQNNLYDADEYDSEEYPDSYFQVPLQLLDLMHTLHAKTAQIHSGWIETNTEQEINSLWSYGWCPLLQGISRLCSDPRKSVRMSAITYLQRALLMHDLQKLKANEWESCFNSVLFPLLEKLAEPFQSKDFIGVEETRMRAATLLSKVFLHHLSPLQLLPGFISLWLKILDFMSRYMNIDKNSDLLNEAIQECVKNMILVMESAQLFSDNDDQSQFWDLTWEKVDKFVPNLREELFRYHSSVHDGNDQQTQSPSSPDTQKNDYKDQNTSKEENVDFKQTDISLIKHSVPIFPHMGQLISTPIGPPLYKNHEDKYPKNIVGVNENYNFQTQMSSLIASNTDFLPSLPSFKTQSPSPINKYAETMLSSSPPFNKPVNLELLSNVFSQSSYSHSVLPDFVNSQSPESASCTQSGSPVEVNSFPYVIQRSSSVCETSAENARKLNIMPEITRTESFPVLSQTYPSLNEPQVSDITCVEVGEHKLIHPQSTDFILTDEKRIILREADDVKCDVLTTEVKANESPLTLSFPVYSGFAELNTDAVGTVEESNAKQFFYQNW